jgi:hypothetical protein
MNHPTVIETKDPFRAAYLLRYGEFKHSRMEDNSTLYVLAGEKLFEEDYRYRTGYASVNPLLLKESYELLLELSSKNREDSEPFELIELADDEEIDLLADDDEKEEEL